MAIAETEDDYWRYSVLFLKVVDARFLLWNEDVEGPRALLNEYWPLIAEDYQKRCRKWADKRERTLFGAAAPPLVFLAEPTSPAA